MLCTSQFQNRPSVPTQTPGHLTFLKDFGQISRYVACLDGQMPHPLELQRGSNLSPSRHVKATVQNFFPCVKLFIQMYTYSVINNWLLFGLRFGGFGINWYIIMINTKNNSNLNDSKLQIVSNFGKE